jgi:hypothetical protein
MQLIVSFLLFGEASYLPTTSWRVAILNNNNNNNNNNNIGGMTQLQNATFLSK